MHFRRDLGPDVVLAGLLMLGTFAVHDVGYMFTTPFWTDEAWVAISTKLPLADIASVSASTPVGWSLLLRLVPGGGDERLRLVPLLFSAAVVVAAYVYVRSLPWPRLTISRLAAVLAGLAGLLTPSALARDDLKQYTADAFLALVVLWFVGRVQEDASRRRLLTLGAVSVSGFLFSAVGVFVGAAAFGSVLLAALIGRRWTEFRQAGIIAAGAAAMFGLIFLVLYRPGIPPGLKTYWSAYYVPIDRGWSACWSFLRSQGEQMATYLGMGPLVVALLLVAVGVVTLARMQRPALALLVPALLVEMILLAAVKQYPLFDERTSHFLTVVLAVTAAIGAGGMCTFLWRLHWSAAVVAAAMAAVLFVTGDGVRSGIRSHSIPVEDLRTPTRFIAEHRRPGDVVVVAMLSSWGFAYYWSSAPGGGGQPASEHVESNLQRFVTVFPDQPEILVATDRTVEAVDAVMDQAAAKAGPAARIWVIHQHTLLSESAAFTARARVLGFQAHTEFVDSLDLLTR
ncbi:hypothetical protein [Nakamurella panacisegetis]|uniref:hypothetical protein n=1 Tax=Nakamurella panacisegetis TaxID=1090615 RepID=UPI0012FE3E35|nr:hypothetical protein [Nakamurella panacisegetis]